MGSRRPKCAQRSQRLHAASIARHRRLVSACEMVEVTPFREQFIWLRDTKQITSADLCWRMGWIYRPSVERCVAERRRHTAVKPDTTRALRVLGLRVRGDAPRTQLFITYDQAVRLADALGMEPHEAGI